MTKDERIPPLDGPAHRGGALRRIGARWRAFRNRRIIEMRNDVDRVAAELRHEMDRLHAAVRQMSGSFEWLAARHAHDMARLAPVAAGPTVTVILPVWNRAPLVGEAIESVRAQIYPRWELIVVDDGSDDGTAGAVGQHLGDTRIRLLGGPRGGPAAARNRGLAVASGEIVAYLDSDNLWFPHHLQEVVRAFGQDPTLDCLYAAQLVRDSAAGISYLRADPFDRARLEAENYIDLNVLAHRRRLYEAQGGFDEALIRGEDWDLALRYTAHRPAVALPHVGGIYRTDAPNRLLATAAAEPNLRRIGEKHGPRPGSGLRVLCLLRADRDLAKDWVATQAGCLERLGVELAVWSADRDGRTGRVDGREILRGDLGRAIAAFVPDVVHGFGGEVVAANWPLLGGCDATVTLCTRVLDPAAQLARTRFLHADPTRPKEAPELGHDLPAVFDSALFYPAPPVDRRLVLHVAPPGTAGDALAWLRPVAEACPGWRFVVATREAAANVAEGLEAAPDLQETAPVELAAGLSREDVAALTRRAAIYLHPGAASDERDRPEAAVAALAAGCWVICPRGSSVAACAGPFGREIRGAGEAAAAIAETADWDEARWQQAERAAAERAYRNFADTDVLRLLVDTWLTIAPPGRRLAAE